MASKDEQMELGKLIVQTGLNVRYIKDVQIREAVNEHATMTVRFVSGGEIQASEVARQQGTQVKLSTIEGETVFCGICTNMNLFYENEYTEVELHAMTATVQTDKEKRSHTFQGLSKTMEQVLTQGIGQQSIVDFEPGLGSFVVAEMLSQKDETDWVFGRRIANQYQKQFFVNSKTSGSHIHVGNLPFQKKEIGMVLSESIKRDVDKVRALQKNIQPDVSVFEYENTILVVSDLTIGVGYAVNWQNRTQTVIKSVITCRRGLVQNEITLANEEGIGPSAEQKMGTEKHSSILTGTVLEIDKTNVKVDFGSKQDEPRWVPYAHAINNYFYTMPDVGDTVFVYYETGDSDKIVCLGSKHVNESPDFARYQDKMLTANNRMIKFGEKSVELIGNRAEYDGKGGDQALITFNDEMGITIQSTNEIRLQTTDGGNITIQSVGDDFKGMDSIKSTFEQMYTVGNTKYITGAGIPDFGAAPGTKAGIFEKLKQNVTDYITAPLQLIDTVEELAGRIGGSEEEGAAQDEGYKDGKIDIYSLETLVLNVGSSSIAFSKGIIQIKAGKFRTLGTDRSKSFAAPSWFDMILDVAQIALDIVGALPIPGLATAANLINAGISLARGDYVGAAMSAGMAALSLIPGANSAVAIGKAAVSAVVKGSRVLKKFSAAAKAVKVLATGATNVNIVLKAGMSAWDVGSAMVDGTFDWDDPECRQDVMNMLQAASAGAQARLARGRRPKQNNAKNTTKNATKMVNERKRAKQNERTDTRCKNGEPIDMVTGSYLIEQCDFLINDICDVYAVERTYESLLAADDSPIGRGWTLSLFSTAYIYDDRVEVVLPDNHTETFLKTEHGYRNRRGGTKRIALCAQEDGYLLTEAETGHTRLYNTQGLLMQETDRSGNRRVYYYTGNTLSRISFASGQYLDFVWKGNHIVSIQDCLGRKVSYHYEGEVLTEVEMVTGGVEKYAYDGEGRVTDITDANGITYVHNEYDKEGRVTRQMLYDGQEYVMLYNDDDRANAYLMPKSNRTIQYTYNRNRQLICTRYQDGTTQERGYDEWENIVWQKDRNGNETRRVYDEYSHLLTEECSNGLIISYEYDTAGNCLHMWDNGGTNIQYTYDKNGNLIKRVEQIDASISRSNTYEYDRYGRVITFTDANGHKETYKYDSSFWESTAFTTPGGSTYQYQLDNAGRCVSVTNADGTSVYAYNSFDILSMKTDPLGNTTRYLYDRVSDLIGLVRPNHHAPEDASETKEIYKNDAFHRRMARIDCTGAVYAVHRDGEGNVIKEISPNAYDSQTNDGKGITYTYDEYDNNIAECYPNGGVMRKWYDPMGNLIKICMPSQYDKVADSGAGCTYEYDSMGRIVQETAPDQTVFKRYVYDLHGNVVKAIHAQGIATGDTDEERIGTLYSYNYLGWLMESRIPVCEQDGTVLYQLTKYKYDKEGNRIQERQFCEYQTIDSESGIVHTIDYTYDADDRLVKISDCTGAVLEYRYDANNRRIFEKRKINDHTEQIFRYTYDAGGRLVELNRTADKEGCGRGSVSVKYEYDKNGNNTKVSLPTGAQILRAYDKADRLIMERHVDKAGGIDNTTRLSYDKMGNLVSITDNLGRKTQIEYDLMNHEIKRVERDGSVTRQFYNLDGYLSKVIRPKEYARAGENGKGLQYTYDAKGNVLTVVRADGTIQELNTYDVQGNLLHTRDGMGSGADIQYDLGGRRTQIVTKGKASQRYEYDAMGNMIGIIDGAGNHTKYSLDKWGRITQIHRADGSSEFYRYDYAGNLTSSIDGEGHTTTYEYNSINKMATRTDPMGSQEMYYYDQEERMCRRIDRNGTTIRYDYNIYDSLTGRYAKKLDGQESCQSYEYTPEGLLKSAVSEGMRYSYTYDALERLIEKKASGKTLLSFQYDLNGNVEHQTDVTGKMTTYHYDLSDHVTEVWDNGTKIASYEYNVDATIKGLHCGNLYTRYDYDADRNLTHLKTLFGTEVLTDNQYTYDGNGNRLEKIQKHGTIKYSYDNMKRLAKVEYPNATEELFYDKAGNRTRRLYHQSEELYQYDRRNQLITYTKDGISTSYEYDKAGNLLKDHRAQYEYDALNRTTKIETFDGNIQINRYDAEGLRHEMEENGRLVSFIFRNDEIVVEQSSQDTIRYIRANILIASDAESAKTYYHYASDELSSITHIVDCEADKICNRYEYDAWGNQTICEEEVANRFKYNGQQFDAISQQYYLRARYYNPVIGRFIQEDTYWGDGLNLYAYCANNPVFYMDPSGYSCQSSANKLKGQANTKKTAQNQKGKKNGETSATAIGKKVHAQKAEERRKSGEYDSVNERLKDANGNDIQVPRTVTKKNQKESIKQQAAMPDAVKGPDKGGIIIDDKPDGRPIGKDYQEVGRFVEAYKEKYGVAPNEIQIERYDPKTGATTKIEVYNPSDFDRYNPTQTPIQPTKVILVE